MKQLTVRLYAILSGLLCLSQTWGQEYGNFSNWCASLGTSSTLIGTKVYYSYGAAILRNNLEIDQNCPYLWELDLSASLNVANNQWDHKLDRILQLRGIKKSIDIPSTVENILWSSKNPPKVFETGGYFWQRDPITRQRAIWSYDISSGKWELVQTTGDEIDRVSHAAFTSSQEDNLHFYVGGLTTEKHQTENAFYRPWQAGTLTKAMVIFNSSANTLRNRSLDDLGVVSSTSPWRKGGFCKHVPVKGTKGVLVCHSHFFDSRNGEIVDDVFEPSEYFEWTTWQSVDIYDIDGDKWYVQYTSADTDYPPKQLNGCSAIASTGNGSYEIYIYGGSRVYYGMDEWEKRKHVWVLAIPSFRWFRINRDLAEARWPLAAHSCEVVGKYLITLGGIIINATYNDTGGIRSEENTCSEAPFRIYDIENNKVILKWTDEYMPSTYVPPQIVADWSKGHKMPEKGWDIPEVEYLFYPTPSLDNPLIGPVIGGVAGGILGLAVIGVVVWWARARAWANHERDLAGLDTCDLTPNDESKYGLSQAQHSPIQFPSAESQSRGSSADGAPTDTGWPRGV